MPSPRILSAALAMASLMTLTGPTAQAMESTDFRTLGPNLLASGADWQRDRGSWERTGSGGYRLEGPGSGLSNFRLPLTLESNTEYFFSVRVRSEGRLVAFLAGLSMSYHDQGSWQEICGLIRIGVRGNVELRLALSSLNGQPVTADLESLELVKVERPTRVVSRPPDGNTVLASQGRAQTVIIYPEGGEALGQKVQSGVEAVTGVRLPLVSDREATDRDWPIIKPEYRSSNLIVIGRLATNRALWASYNRFLSAEDGYYPGGNGFVVRTAADVFGNGKNHLVLGGSTDEGVGRAVDHFLKQVGQHGQGGTLPWLLEVELGGTCAEAFAQDRERWADPSHPRLAAMTAGYGKVTRWYENAMGYYWTSAEDYLERAQSYLRQILDDRAQTHHYIVEFFVRTTRMFRDSPVFNAKEINELDSLILENFLDFLTITDLNWMTVFSPPYETIRIVNRHQIAPWYSDLVMARYLERNVVLTGRLKALVDFRESEKRRAFDHFAATRQGPSLPGIAAGSDYEEIPASFFRYALEDEHYEAFFGSGLAEQALVLNRLDPVTGRLALPGVQMDIGMWVGAVAHLTGDGRYQWVLDNVYIAEEPRGPFQGRYVAGVHRYQTGGEIETVEPGDAFIGIQVAPQPHLWDQTPEATFNQFPQVAIRGGTGPEDDFTVIAGVDPRVAPGVIVRMVADGMPLLGGSQMPGVDSRLTTNSADSMRVDDLRYLLYERPASEARIEWLGQFPSVWGVGIHTQLSPFIDWKRSFLRFGKGTYVFVDRFTAKREGEYLLRTAWQPDGSIRPMDGGWEIYNNRGRALIRSYGEGFQLRDLKGSLVDEAVVTLAQDETATLWTVLQKAPAGGYAWQVLNASDNQLELNGPEGKITLHQGPVTSSQATLDASLIVRSADAYAVFGLHEEGQIPYPSFYLAKSDDHQLPDGWAPPSSPANLVAFLDRSLDSNRRQTQARPAQSVSLPKVEDASSDWHLAWLYEGLKRPARVNPRRIDENTIDFGREVSLAEIRSRVTLRGPWLASFLPERILVAPPGMQSLPGDGQWIEPALTRVSRPGTRTGNYGESTPVEHADQSAFAENVSTRYVRAEGAPSFYYFINDHQESRHPVHLQWLPEALGDGLIVAANNTFPQFVRPRRDDDISLAILEPDGQAITELDLTGNVEMIRIADQQGHGELEIFALKADASLERFDLAGQHRQTVNMHAQHEHFNAVHGNPNTRHPAGGHRMPFSMGFWRQGDGGKKLYVSRYGSMAFHDANFDLEGVLNVSGYGFSAALEEGYDFSGDGLEETMIVERFRLVHFGGSHEPRVRDPGSARFWPEVYEPLAIAPLQGSSSNLLSGPEMFEFRRLEMFGGRGNFVVVMRGDFIGLYDGADRKFAFSWAPEIPLTTAAVLHESEDKLILGLTTVDGLFWRVEVNPRRLTRPTLSVQPLNLWINALQPFGPDGSSVVICADEGLYLFETDAPLQLIRPGAWRDAIVLPDASIVAADAEGGVSRFMH